MSGRLKVGDRVCMEPGVPNLSSRATKLGIYNVDPDVSFWATPPVHGVLTPYVVHPGRLHLQAAGQCLLRRRRDGRALRHRHAGGEHVPASSRAMSPSSSAAARSAS